MEDHKVEISSESFHQLILELDKQKQEKNYEDEQYQRHLNELQTKHRSKQSELNNRICILECELNKQRDLIRTHHTFYIKNVCYSASKITFVGTISIVSRI